MTMDVSHTFNRNIWILCFKTDEDEQELYLIQMKIVIFMRRILHLSVPISKIANPGFYFPSPFASISSPIILSDHPRT
jgi:hypothetical protein